MIRVNGGEPLAALLPATTTEGFGGRILELLFTGLFEHDPAGRLRPAMAASLRSTGPRTHRITLRPGWCFDDGSPVTAHSYVDAWNAAADPAHDWAQRARFSEMAGVAVDDHTIEVELAAPDPTFPDRLASPAFAPLPRSLLGDPGAWRDPGLHPCGNGPYRLAGGRRRPGDALVLEPRPGHERASAPRNDCVVFLAHPTLDDAWAAFLRGELDVLDCVPDAALASVAQELGERAVVTPVSLNKSLCIPYSTPHFAGEEGRLRRAAVSMAIDRRAVTESEFGGLRTPARDFTASSLPGWIADVPGHEVLDHRPAAARELWRRADAVAPWSGTFDIAYNRDGGHDGWIAALARQVSCTLGITARPVPHPTFREIRAAVADGTLRTAFRTGWRGEHPTQLDFLESQYASGAPANDAGYACPEFDTALTAARAAAADPARHAELVARAQTVLLRDLPALPLWEHVTVAALAPGVRAGFRWNGLPDYPRIARNPVSRNPGTQIPGTQTHTTQDGPR